MTGTKESRPRAPTSIKRAHSSSCWTRKPTRFTFQTFDDTRRSRGASPRSGTARSTSLAGHLTELQQAGAGVFVTDQRDRRSAAAQGGEHRRRARRVRRPRRRPARAGHGVRASSRTSRSRARPGKYHAYWRVHDLPLDQFKGVQKAIAARFDGDSRSTTCRASCACRLLAPESRAVHGPLLWKAPPSEPYSAEQLLARVPADAPRPAAPPAAATTSAAELVRQVMTAESFHEPLVRLAWRFIRDGMPAGQGSRDLEACCSPCRSPMTRDGRRASPRSSRTVASAAAKQSAAPALDIIFNWYRRQLPAQHRQPTTRASARARRRRRLSKI